MSDSYRTFMKPRGEHIEPHLVIRLNYLMEKTGAHIVVSSSWKSNMEDLEKQMIEQGFEYWNQVIGRTPFSGEMGIPYEKSGLRGLQIERWLEESEVEIEHYVVLEDEPVDVCGDKCNAIEERFVVFVDLNEGLSHANTLDAIDILHGRDLIERDRFLKVSMEGGLFKWQARQAYDLLEDGE